MKIGVFEGVPVQDGNIVRLVEAIFSCALKREASDIHIEPLENCCRVRIRVDGLLVELCRLPIIRHNAIVSRIKLLSEMDISERRLPQDGRLEAIYLGSTIDFRIASLPTLLGEKLAIRILDKHKSLLELDGLGFTEERLQQFKRLINMANGLVLITGPTGSGKTTTLYAALKAINADYKNIITIEDPIEYKLEGINQVAVQRKIGLDFASSLRAIVRQDPNIIMLGEIRDLASAEIAVQAAMTGHLVFSTLHTNSALGAIDRLLDLGIEPFILLSCLRGVVAQRLVRRVCSSCSFKRPPTQIESFYFARASLKSLEVVEGKGCSNCNGMGYKGRLALQELLLMDEELVRLVLQRVEPSERLRYLRSIGYSTLQEDGLQKVLSGQTTIAELLREALL